MSRASAHAKGLRDAADAADFLLRGDLSADLLRAAADLIERQAQAIATARVEFGKIWPNGSACEHRHAAAGFNALEVADG